MPVSPLTCTHMKYKSQAGQDKFVEQYFARSGLSGKYFLDVGAFDGIHFSNTYYLETILGWQGLCVEASADSFRSLSQNRRCNCANIVISSHNGILQFQENGMGGCVVTDGGEPLHAATLETVMREYGCPPLIDYVSLDIEGSEYDALLGFPFHSFKARLWTIEHNKYCAGEFNKMRIFDLMAANGYTRIREDVCSHDDSRYPFEDWYLLDEC